MMNAPPNNHKGDSAKAANEAPEPSEAERKKLRQFEVVALGCHERARKRISEFLRRKWDIDMFLFIEYFCIAPVLLAKRVTLSKSTELFFPFIRRIVEDNQFVWIPAEGKKTTKDKNDWFQLRPTNRHVRNRFGDPIKFRYGEKAIAPIGRRIFKWWTRHGRWSSAGRESKAERPVEYFDDNAWRRYLKRITKAEVPDIQRELALEEFGLAGEPWRRNCSRTLMMGVPIASSSIFYGYFLLFLEPPPVDGEDVAKPTKEEERKKKLERQLWKMLGDIADEIYLPVLTLLAESFLEYDLKTCIEDEDKGGTWWTRADTWFSDTDNPFRPCSKLAVKQEEDKKRAKGKPILHNRCPGKARVYDKDYELPLHRCWVRRKRLLEALEARSETKEAPLEFLRRLPLAKYNVASPGLLEKMKLVMGADLEMPQKPMDSLPAALIYGGPGSGKDVMAQLVALFSDHYFWPEMHTLNMAAIRPPAITGPLLQGLRLSGPSVCDEAEDLMQLADRSTQLQGLFLQAKERERKRFKEGEAANELGATFILDELNSLDVDLQGVLLRVLEQGEVMPLGGLCKDYVQHLIVGIVNEDPEQITREGELRDLLVEKGKLGSLVSGLLYETLRRTRRLRDDLYHRLKRQLYIRVPEIKDRRADIPMLFFFAGSEEAERIKEDLGILVELRAYSLLMDSKYTWPGNIRQIQAVARKSIEKARKDTDVDAPNVKDLPIVQSHVQAALEDEFSDVFGR